MPSWFKLPKNTKLAPRASSDRHIPEGLWTKCPKCQETVPKKDWDDALSVCPKCGHHDRLPARRRIELLLDPETFAESDANLAGTDPLEFGESKGYISKLQETRESTGITEGAVTGTGRIEGQRVAIAVMDMRFIGGSMGVAVGEKIARTLEMGLNERIPVILICASGGARMQEGILSLMQMAKTCAVAARLHEARIPLITLLTDPTTGGVTASFALIGDIIIAEPQALVGFAGQRVIEATIRQVLPPGFQRAEFLCEHGMIDLVVKRTELRQTLARLLSFLAPPVLARPARRPQGTAQKKAPSLTVEPVASAS